VIKDKTGVFIGLVKLNEGRECRSARDRASIKIAGFLLSNLQVLPCNLPMSTRIFFAGILGGIVMFIWSFIGHDVLPLGQAGVSQVPNEQSFRDSLATTLTDRGLYMFPWPHVDPKATSKEKKEAMESAMEQERNGPSGILMYHPKRDFSFAKLLGIEFATELIEALLLVWILAQTRIESFGGRVGFIFMAGILAAMTTNVPYWNWYGFPAVYTASYMSIEIVGFLCVGIVAALMLGKRSPQPPPNSVASQLNPS
jgi:hypothetical protein